jgi:hypothetical protein
MTEDIREVIPVNRSGGVNPQHTESSCYLSAAIQVLMTDSELTSAILNADIDELVRRVTFNFGDIFHEYEDMMAAIKERGRKKRDEMLNNNNLLLFKRQLLENRRLTEKQRGNILFIFLLKELQNIMLEEQGGKRADTWNLRYLLMLCNNEAEADIQNNPLFNSNRLGDVIENVIEPIFKLFYENKETFGMNFTGFLNFYDSLFKYVDVIPSPTIPPPVTHIPLLIRRNFDNSQNGSTAIGPYTSNIRENDQDYVPAFIAASGDGHWLVALNMDDPEEGQIRWTILDDKAIPDSAADETIYKYGQSDAYPLANDYAKGTVFYVLREHLKEFQEQKLRLKVTIAERITTERKKAHRNFDSVAQSLSPSRALKHNAVEMAYCSNSDPSYGEEEPECAHGLNITDGSVFAEDCVITKNDGASSEVATLPAGFVFCDNNNHSYLVTVNKSGNFCLETDKLGNKVIRFGPSDIGFISKKIKELTSGFEPLNASGLIQTQFAYKVSAFQANLIRLAMASTDKRRLMLSNEALSIVRPESLNAVRLANETRAVAYRDMGKMFGKDTDTMLPRIVPTSRTSEEASSNSAFPLDIEVDREQQLRADIDRVIKEMEGQFSSDIKRIADVVKSHGDDGINPESLQQTMNEACRLFDTIKDDIESKINEGMAEDTKRDFLEKSSASLKIFKKNYHRTLDQVTNMHSFLLFKKEELDEMGIQVCPTPGGDAIETGNMPKLKISINGNEAIAVKMKDQQMDSDGTGSKITVEKETEEGAIKKVAQFAAVKCIFDLEKIDKMIEKLNKKLQKLKLNELSNNKKIKKIQESIKHNKRLKSLIIRNRIATFIKNCFQMLKRKNCLSVLVNEYCAVFGVENSDEKSNHANKIRMVVGKLVTRAGVGRINNLEKGDVLHRHLETLTRNLDNTKVELKDNIRSGITGELQAIIRERCLL